MAPLAWRAAASVAVLGAAPALVGRPDRMVRPGVTAPVGLAAERGSREPDRDAPGVAAAAPETA